MVDVSYNSSTNKVSWNYVSASPINFIDIYKF